MTQTRKLRLAVMATVVVVLLAAVLYLARADRYRLYTSPHAARCWDSVQALAPPTSSLRLAGIDVLDTGPGSGIEVVVGHRMDRVLGGLELEARCSYPADSLRASAIAINGQPVDAGSLENVNDSVR